MLLSTLSRIPPSKYMREVEGRGGEGDGKEGERKGGERREEREERGADG